MFYTYVLESLKNGKLYTGSSENVEKRLIEHDSGKTKSTKANCPYQLIYQEEYKTRPDAVRREMFFKSGRGRQLLKEILEKNKGRWFSGRTRS